MIETFSNRHGFHSENPEISVRYDAPESLRGAIVMIAKRLGLRPKQLRLVLCSVLLVRPDPQNWTDYPNVWEEVTSLIDGCAWHKVYDVAEGLYAHLESGLETHLDFEDLLNQFFLENGIGWKMTGGQILFRGEGTFTPAEEAANILSDAGRRNAASEMREAHLDISRRPQPDVTGAIHHAMAALEATARDLTGKSNATLGQLVSELNLPRPLDEALSKLWGFASNSARHVKEGQNVDAVDAELVVGVAASVCIYLANRDKS